MADRPDPAAFRRVFHMALLAAVFALLFALLTACSSRELFHPSPSRTPSCGEFTVHHSDGTVTRHGRPC